MRTSRARRLLASWIAVTAAFAWLAPTASAGDAAAGKAIFLANCSPCHGETGKGDGPVGMVLQPRPRNFAEAHFVFDTDGDGKVGTDADLKNVITKGAAAFGGSPLMAPWPTFSDADVENIIAFIRTLKQP